MSSLNTLLFLQYNNYFNRKVLFENDYENYIASAKNYAPFSNINFNPNDGVDTEHIINWDKEWNPDYMVLFDENTKIVSRWFVTEAVRTRGKQYKITLRRDVISDYYHSVTEESPCFIEKGYVSSESNLIFNPENFLANQIKSNEKLLLDNTRCSWLVLYYNLSKKSDLKGTNVSTKTNPEYIQLDVPISEFYREIQASNYKRPTSYQYKMRIRWGTSTNSYIDRFVLDEESQYIRFESEEYRAFPFDYLDLYYLKSSRTELINQLVGRLATNKSQIKAYLLTEYQPTVSFDEISFYNNKIVKDSLNNIYRIHFKPTGRTETIIENVNSGNFYNSIFNTLDILNRSSVFYTLNEDFEDALEKRIELQEYSLSYEEVQLSSTFSFDLSSCKDLNDAPYGMIALPYKTSDNKTLYVHDGDTAADFVLDPAVPMAIVKELTKAGVGSDKVIFDVQLLPYCPIPYAESNFNQYGTYLMEEALYASDYTYIRSSNDDIVGIVLHPSESKFTFNIDYLTEEVPDDAIEFKINNQCNFVRLCSPNYNGMFEFSIEKNRGISYFNVDCTYKPFQPYIHINPDFKGLYGNDYNDPRGLICGGDFSITVVSSAWEQYKMQNKNYQEIFNRQIENLDVTQQIAKEKATFAAVTGIIGGGVAGGTKGAAGGPWGAVAGAVAGTVTAGVATGFTMDWLKRSQAEQRDYAIDQHNYQLQNIQALPDSLCKVDAFNNNNKIFPVLEYYTCTDEEKTVLHDKIKYEGMTLNILGKIAEYISPVKNNTFIKGRMIRIEGVNDDTHLLNAIYEEIAKGVYL